MTFCEFLTFHGHSEKLVSMDDGHFFTFATVALGIVLFFVLGFGGLFIYLFLSQNKKKDES